MTPFPSLGTPPLVVKNLVEGFFLSFGMILTAQRAPISYSIVLAQCELCPR